MDDGAVVEKSQSLDGVSGELWDDNDPRMKKLLRKVDARILLVLGFIYCISLLDRTVCIIYMFDILQIISIGDK